MGLSPGFVIPNTPIAVDRFTRRCEARLFFLTHIHSDHTVGLSPTWALGPIFCSPLTKRLLLHKFKGLNPRQIFELEIGVAAEVSLEALPWQTSAAAHDVIGGGATVTVTPIEANHCPGAVMYLFQGYFGNVLATGDFRFDPNEHLPILGPPLILDVVYLDNTYCRPNCVFPPRTEAAARVIEIVREHTGHYILIGVDSIGKEALLVDVAMALKVRLCITARRMALYRLLQLPDVFTTNPSDSPIHVCMKQEVTAERVRRESETQPTIGIIPTALFVGSSGIGGDSNGTAINGEDGDGGRDDNSSGNISKSKGNSSSSSSSRPKKNPGVEEPLIHVVPFSNHSSFEELRAFVRGIRTHCIIPMLKDGAFDPHILGRIAPPAGTQTPFPVKPPQGVWDFMKCGGSGKRGGGSGRTMEGVGKKADAITVRLAMVAAATANLRRHRSCSDAGTSILSAALRNAPSHVAMKDDIQPSESPKKEKEEKEEDGTDSSPEMLPLLKPLRRSRSLPSKRLAHKKLLQQQTTKVTNVTKRAKVLLPTKARGDKAAVAKISPATSAIAATAAGDGRRRRRRILPAWLRDEPEPGSAPTWLTTSSDIVRTTTSAATAAISKPASTLLSASTTTLHRQVSSPRPKAQQRRRLNATAAAIVAAAAAAVPHPSYSTCSDIETGSSSEEEKTEDERGLVGVKIP